MIDERLLAYDPRPNMDIFRELYIEAMRQLKQQPAAPPVAIADDDR